MEPTTIDWNAEGGFVAATRVSQAVKMDCQNVRVSTDEFARFVQ